MHEGALRALLSAVQTGHVPLEQALSQLRDLPFADLGYAQVDHHRALRVGLPEVVFGLGKTSEQIVGIVSELRDKGQAALVTRVDTNASTALALAFPGIELHALARTAFLPSKTSDQHTRRGQGPICVVTAGTSDIPVAAEATVTARAFGNDVVELYDVGVAGPHRLLARREVLQSASVLIVVAGMEGALASVVGGLVSRPVIAVPTSIGYGASLGGIAALLSMLNSCASGVTVVNIDNGFGAAYAATLMNQAFAP
jgi:NCAIR mutase (PurE)-related protein